jgi:hypothetical protein
MTVNYCTCTKKSKDVFSGAPFICGIVINSLLILMTIVFLIGFEHIGGIFLVIFMPSLFLYNYIDYKRQALYLKHTEECAVRYARIATFVTCRGYAPEYGYLSNYIGIPQAVFRHVFGVRKGNRIYRIATKVGWVLLVVFILYMLIPV